jgi:hypothetical protein
MANSEPDKAVREEIKPWDKPRPYQSFYTRLTLGAVVHGEFENIVKNTVNCGYAKTVVQA